MSSLITCDSYSLDIVLSYVSGASILRLVMCGSPLLSAKIFSCTRLDFTWHGPGRSRWPSLIRHFGQLTTFRYQNAEDIRYLPCSDVKISDLPRSLRCLRLSYFDPFSSLFTGSVLSDGTLHYTSLDYATNFPHLNTLKIYSKVALAPTVAALFPASLTSLKVKCKESFDSASMLPYLSRGLKHLSMNPVRFCDEEELWKQFPPLLESLDLFFDAQSPCWIQYLPASLTSLKVTVNDWGGQYIHKWPLLPRQLKSLSLWGVVQSFELDLYLQLPPTLEKLIWPISMIPPRQEYVDSELEKISAFEAYDAYVESLFSSRPASLTNLDFYGLEFCAKTLEACPWRYKEVTIRNASDLSEKTLPALSKGAFASLTDLTIYKGALTAEVAAELPKTIKKLSIHGVTNSVALAIGKRLVSLKELSCLSGSLAVSGASGLPQSISTLILGHAVLESIECLEKLPKRLKELTFETSHDRGESAIGAIQDPRASNLIPPTVTELSVYLPRLSEDWFKGLAQHPSLDELRVSFRIKLSSNVLSYLPKNIKRITLSIPKLDGKAFKNMPRSVRFLNINGSRSAHVNNEDLALIPENAYYIRIPTQRINEGGAKFLPKNVYELRVDGIQPAWFKHDFDQFPHSRP